ncbi:MAG: helix-turn-helix transcriptional regulator, partial [Muribaculaceae bacterium]|nr:helix-turn-helix transcriptional regulator [Muribaculaceae bacterium]
TVEQLASDVGLSRVHLHRKLKALTNQSPRDFIRNTRLRQAARLLREKDLSVAEVADLTGFSNAGSFTTSFKRLFGVTPSEYSEAKTEETAN